MIRHDNLLQYGVIACLTILISGCAGSPKMARAENNVCPELTGSYCAEGLSWNRGDTELASAYLPFYLGVQSRAGWRDVDRVDIEGASNGTLTVTLRSGDTEFDKAVISEPDLVCGTDYAAVRMQTIPWGGAGPILALGASSGWRMMQRRDDGSLRVDEQRYETGTVFFVLPLRFANDSALKFGPYAEGACSN